MQCFHQLVASVTMVKWMKDLAAYSKGCHFEALHSYIIKNKNNRHNIQENQKRLALPAGNADFFVVLL